MVGISIIQRDFLNLLERRYGLGAALAAVPLQLVFFIGCGIAVPLGYLRYLQDRGASRSA